jgi:hypothetical protein
MKKRKTAIKQVFIAVYDEMMIVCLWWVTFRYKNVERYFEAPYHS